MGIVYLRFALQKETVVSCLAVPRWGSGVGFRGTKYYRTLSELMMAILQKGKSQYNTRGIARGLLALLDLGAAPGSKRTE